MPLETPSGFDERAKQDMRSDALVVRLWRAEDEKLLVGSIDIRLEGMRNCYAFDEGRSLGDVFAPDIARQILDRVPGYGNDQLSLALPSLSVRGAGVALNDARIEMQKLVGGCEEITLCFRECVGPLTRAFVFQPEFRVDAPVLRERLAVDVLRDIVTPVFDLMCLNDGSMSHLIENNAEAISRRLKLIEMRREEISFYVGLLQRYVAGCKNDSKSRNMISGQLIHDEGETALSDVRATGS